MPVVSPPTPMFSPMRVQPGTRPPTAGPRFGLWHSELCSQSVGAAGLMTGSPVRVWTAAMCPDHAWATWAMAGSAARGARPALWRALLSMVRSWVSALSVAGVAEAEPVVRATATAGTMVRAATPARRRRRRRVEVIP